MQFAKSFEGQRGTTGREQVYLILHSNRGSDLLQIDLLDSTSAFCILALPQALAQGLFLVNDNQWPRQNFWVIIQQVWFLFKAMLSVFCMIKSEYRPTRDILPKAMHNFCHECAPEFPPLAESL